MADIREQQLATARALYDTTGKGDWAGAEALLTDDFYVTEASTLPYAGVYRGRAALRELFTQVMGSMNVTGLEVKAMTQGDDHVVAILELVLGSSGNRVQVAEMFRFRGDRVCEIRPYYFDPTPVLAEVKGAKG
jgi:ketosteroid isomerase-like protein